jgi:hypothetical protein
VKIKGAGASPTGPAARFNRGNTAGTAYVFNFRGADDVTIDRLALTGAATGILSYVDTDSDRVTVSNSDVFGMPNNGIQVWSGSDNWTIVNNRIHDIAGGQGTGVSFNGSFTAAAIRGNEIFNNPRYGIYVNTGFATAVINGNEVYGSGTGIASNAGTIESNRVHHNTAGIVADRGVTRMAGNMTWNNADGITVTLNDGNRRWWWRTTGPTTTPTSASPAGTTRWSATTPPTPTASASSPRDQTCGAAGC